MGIWFATNGVHWAGISGQRTNTANWSTHLSFYTHEDATSDLNYTRERMRISSEGNVGIGTTSPDGIFHVKTASAVHRSRFESGNSHSLVRLIAASSSNSGVEFYSGSTNTGNITGDSSSNLIFEPGGIARMSMNSTGCLLYTSDAADE